MHPKIVEENLFFKCPLKPFFLLTPTILLLGIFWDYSNSLLSNTNFRNGGRQ